MEMTLQIKMNDKLFLRDPENSELGKKIIQQSILLIHKNGFEAFTFKKLAELIVTTEAGVYRYFENKHKLLMYITAWYWSWLEFRVMVHTLNVKDPQLKLKKVIHLLATTVEDDVSTSYINENILHQIIVAEGSKAYLTKQVLEDNKAHFFEPYKDLCTRIGDIILEYNPGYKYPQSLSSTIVEVAHSQNFFMNYLPALTDFGKSKDESKVVAFLEGLVFSGIR